MHPKLFPAFVTLCLLASLPTTRAFAADAPRPWPPDQFAPVTPERIATLPPAEHPAWMAYLKASQKLADNMPRPTEPDFSPLQPLTNPPAGGMHFKGLRLNAPAAWFASDEARSIANHVIAWQTGAGGWTKGNDYTIPRPAHAAGKREIWSVGTFDNDATTTELRFLAQVNTAAPDAANALVWRKAFLRGLKYIFAAQYPNGGFPQIYPLGGGYHDNVTFNDGAITQLLELLRDVSNGKPEFAFVPAKMRKEGGLRMQRGIVCILDAQIKTADGRRTVWCQQHDALTLKPAAARNFEPIAACGAESAGLVRFLMSLPRPSPEVVAAVDAAVAWFRRVPVQNLTWSKSTNDSQVVPTPGTPPLWARYYELETDKPIFGDRDRTIHYDLSEISAERRHGYTWFVRSPANVLEIYGEWRKKVSPTAGNSSEGAKPR